MRDSSCVRETSSTFCLVLRTHHVTSGEKVRLKERERRRRDLVSLGARQSGNACSVCLLSVDVRLWGAVRHDTGKKSVLQRRRTTYDLHLARFLLNSSSAVAFLTVRAPPVRSDRVKSAVE